MEIGFGALCARHAHPRCCLSLRVSLKRKLHLNRRKEKHVELYDLSADPSESANVAEKHPNVVSSLQNKLQNWVAELPNRYEKSKTGNRGE